MKKIIYLIFALIFTACSNNLKNASNEFKIDLNNDENKFFLFEGNLFETKNKIKLYLTTDDLIDDGVNLHGQFYDLSNEIKFSVNGFIKGNKIYLHFNSKDDDLSSENINENTRFSFEGEILDLSLIHI